MPDWSAGYVADIAYTYGSYAELNPRRIRLAFLMAGLLPPEIGVACELGFGQGMSVNIHAAASTTTWYGTDFNPAQASFARELAAASGADAHLYDQSFEQFCSRTDLPDFDYIALHGIFSWISDENRAIVVDFIRRKLKVGGVLYISYNTQPGWAAMAPLRDLMAEHANVMAAPGTGSTARVEQSLTFVERLLATEPRYLRANPMVKARFDKSRGQDPAYLAHEFFNRDWLPVTFSQMARWLEPAKVDFACSAHYLEHLDFINLSAEQRKLVAEIGDPVFAQTARDVIVNQAFRRDYWVRGARKLDPIALDEHTLQCRVMLLTNREAVPLKATGALGEVTLNEEVYAPLLDRMAGHEALSIGDLMAYGNTIKLSRSKVLQAIFVLVGVGVVGMLQDQDTIDRVAPRAQKLNLHLCALARASSQVQHLAVPATGGQLKVERFHQLFILARSMGGRGPQDWATYAMSVLNRMGQRLTTDGKPIESDADQMQDLLTRATVFRDKILPILVKLGVVA